MRVVVSSLALLFASMLVQPAFASTVTGSGGGFSGSGTLTLSDNGNGTDTIDAISGTGIGNLIATGGFNGNDNLLYPTGSTLVDGSGFSFTDTQGDTSFQVDIFSNGPGSYEAYLLDSDNFSETISVDFTLSSSPGFVSSLKFNLAVAQPQQVSPTPEPSSLVLLGTGLAGVVALGRHRAKR